MAFMELEIESAFGAVECVTEHGVTFYVPSYFAGEDLQDFAPEYAIGRIVETRPLLSGYLARLSAPGYLDCTDWVWASSKREAARLAKG